MCSVVMINKIFKLTNCCESNNDKIQELLASGGFEPAIPTS